MTDFLKHKGYTGTVEYSAEDDILFGKVRGIKSLLLYEGHTIDELKNDFVETVDQYLADCKEDGIEPEKPFKGSLNIRIDSGLHEWVADEAFNHHKSLNYIINSVLKYTRDKGIKINY